MGVIRKTLSITTLGLVGWKSKKELLAETEAELASTRSDLEQTSALRSTLQDRLDAMEQRLSATELESIHDAKAARRDEKRRFRRRRLEAVGKDAEARASKARELAERRAAKARKQAEARAEEARARFEGASKSARKAAKRARKRAEHLADDARSSVDDVASTVRAKVRR